CGDRSERIEVIGGPQSTLYGADAIGGVVNIITRKGKGPFSATAEGGAGNYDTYTGRGWVGGVYSILDYSGSISHFESNGQFKNDSSDKNAVNLRAGLTLPSDTSGALPPSCESAGRRPPGRGQQTRRPCR